MTLLLLLSGSGTQIPQATRIGTRVKHKTGSHEAKKANVRLTKEAKDRESHKAEG